jgi:phosphoserine phosphatase
MQANAKQRVWCQFSEHAKGTLLSQHLPKASMEAVVRHLIHSCCWRTAQALVNAPSAAAIAAEAMQGDLQQQISSMQQRENILKLISSGDLAQVCSEASTFTQHLRKASLEGVVDHVIHSCCWRTAQALVNAPSAAAIAAEAMHGNLQRQISSTQQRENILKLVSSGDLANVCSEASIRAAPHFSTYAFGAD